MEQEIEKIDLDILRYECKILKRKKILALTAIIILFSCSILLFYFAITHKC